MKLFKIIAIILLIAFNLFLLKSFSVNDKNVTVEYNECSVVSRTIEIRDGIPSYFANCAEDFRVKLDKSSYDATGRGDTMETKTEHEENQPIVFMSKDSNFKYFTVTYLCVLFLSVLFLLGMYIYRSENKSCLH